MEQGWTGDADDAAQEEVDQNDNMDTPLYQHDWTTGDWDLYIGQFKTLPIPFREKYSEDPWCHCGECGKQLIMKPWTHFDQGHQALCTSCSMSVWQVESTPAFHTFREMAQEDQDVKEDREFIGIRQNHDLDAPFDWPHELGNINDAGVEDAVEEQQDDNTMEGNGEAQDDGVEMDEPPVSNHTANGVSLRDLEHHHNPPVQVYTTTGIVKKPPTPPTSDSGSPQINGHMINGSKVNGTVHDDGADSDDEMDNISESSFATANEAEE